MLTESDFPQTLAIDLEIKFNEGRQSMANKDYRKLIEVVPTTSDAKKEVFYGDKGRLRRFRGERQPQRFNEYKALITLDDWEYTETVKRQVLDDDQSGGQLKAKVGNFGNAVETSLQMETEEYIRNGVSQRSFDTHMFFEPFHTYVDSSGLDRGVTQGNVHWGGSQLDATTVQIMQSHFANLKSDTGKVLGMRLTDVVVKRGSVNAKTARELANSTFTVEASTVKGQMTENVFKGNFNIIEFDYGLGASEWMGLDLSDPEMKPVKVLSHTVSPGFDNMEYTQLLKDSDTGFWRNEFAFGIFGRFDWNPGDWRTAFLHGSSTYNPVLADNERQRVLQANAF